MWKTAGIEEFFWEKLKSSLKESKRFTAIEICRQLAPSEKSGARFIGLKNTPQKKEERVREIERKLEKF